jgi:hypothetical protein
MAEFDVKRVTTLEWAGIGAGLLAFIVSFFPWYSIDVAGFGGGSLSAWNTGIGAWLPMLMLMAAGVLVLLPHFGVQVQRLTLIWLALAAAAVVIIVLRWLTLPDDGGIGDLGLLGGDSGIESGAGFGLIAGLVVAVVSGVAAFLVFRAAPKPNTTPYTGPAYGA